MVKKVFEMVWHFGVGLLNIIIGLCLLREIKKADK